MAASLRKPKNTVGEQVIAFIERYCLVPEGKHVGKPIRLLAFQKRFILDVYDNPAGTARAYLSMARKNGKSALIACLAVAHLVGPVARLNSQIISGARSRDQAGIIFKLAEKMVRLSPELSKLVRIIPSQKQLFGLPMNVEYRAISAEAGTAHGLSPVVAILDEVGQVKGKTDSFVEAIETAQGAHDNPLLLAISTQAASDNDLFSQWLDDAETSGDPRIVSHVYSADDICDLMDREAWAAANPALGDFRSLQDMVDFATRAERLPSLENSFRWLFLNQRIEASAPFVSRGVWKACGELPLRPLYGHPVYCGLDLSAVNDLTAFVAGAKIDGVWHIHPTFWLPGDTINEKSKQDRQIYNVWRDQGFLIAAPGKSIDYEFVAHFLRGFCDAHNVIKIGFDRWNFRHLRPWLVKAGFSDADIDRIFAEVGQGFADMSPALRAFEAELLNKRIAHGDHPVLTMCAANAVVRPDPAGNRKLDKAKSSGRIDGMVAAADMFAVAPLEIEDSNYRGLYSEQGGQSVESDDGGSLEWEPSIIADPKHPLFAEHKARFERWEALQDDEERAA